ncbi:MAG: hypothetical protein ACYC4L_16830 [Chloroflexota bacterium]
MPCVRPDGQPTRPGLSILRAVGAGARSAEDVTAMTGLPLYRVRGGLRELAEAGYIQPVDYFNYEISAQGATIVQPPQSDVSLG